MVKKRMSGMLIFILFAAVSGIFPAAAYGAPSVAGISVSPDTATVFTGGSCQFNATVSGTGDYDNAVLWNVEGNSISNTEISQSGLLTVDSAESSNTLTVTATSKADPSKKASATVTVQFAEPASRVVILSPAEDSLITAVEGDAVSMRIRAQNAIGYVWHVDENDGNGFMPIDGAEDTVYTIPAVSLDNDGYRFFCWGGNDIFPADSPVFTLRVLRAYKVSVGASPESGGDVTGGGTYRENTSVTVTAEASDGYSFVKWTEDGKDVSFDENYVFNITSHRELEAVFEKQAAAEPTPPSDGQSGDGEKKLDDVPDMGEADIRLWIPLFAAIAAGLAVCTAVLRKKANR